MKMASIFIYCFVFVLVNVAEVATQDFDCTTLNSQAFPGPDGKKCYWTDLTTRDHPGAKAYCEGLDMQSFDDWILVNPRNYLEHSFLRERGAVLDPSGLWWVGQYQRDGDFQFSNIDDPADCPGVFLDWQVGTEQPNGNSDTQNQDEQDCIIFPIMNSDPTFQDKACWRLYGTMCKATTTTGPITCSTAAHAAAFQDTPNDPDSCYVSEDAVEGTSGNTRTWESAVAYCAGLNLGGLVWEVPNILNQGEADYLRARNAELSFSTHNNFYWAGQNDRTEEHVWAYLNQPSRCPPVYLDWLSASQPNGGPGAQLCTAATPHSAEGWQDKDCNELHLTMCEITPPCVSFDENRYVVGEQDGQVTVRINIQDYKTGTVTANLNVQDVSTTMGSDYTLPGSLVASFDGSADYVEVVFLINTNDGAEELESFTITLESPTRGYVCLITSTTVYISEETTSFRLQSSQLVTSEGSSIDITMIRSGFLGNTDQIVLSVSDGSATGSASSSSTADFTAQTSEVITFLPAEPIAVRSLSILSDNVYDDWEDFTVSITIDSSYSATTSILEDPSTAVILIRDLTASQLIMSQYELEVSSTSVLERVAIFEVVVKRTGDSSNDEYVSIATEDVSATAGSDYKAIGPIRVDFMAMDTEESFMLEIMSDEEVEPTEFLQIRLSDPGPNGILGPKNQVLFTIYDNDVSYEFGETIRSVSESVPYITMKLEKQGYLGEETSVTLQTIGNSAILGEDYQFFQTVETFIVNDDEETFRVEIIDDDVPELMESFYVQVIADNVIADSATVWIQDDDIEEEEEEQQQQQDLCPDRYCENNGVCVTDSANSLGLFICICRAGFEGDRCEFLIRQDLCPSIPCRNGGACVQDAAREGFCACEDGFEGNFCENEVPMPMESDQGLSNGGIIGISFGISGAVLLILGGTLATLFWLRRVRASRPTAPAPNIFIPSNNRDMSLYSPYSPYPMDPYLTNGFF